MVPGRRTLISGFSTLGRLTREVKYITPGMNKSWREKHEGIVPALLFSAARDAHVDPGHRVQDVRLGCHKLRTSFMTLSKTRT